MRFCAQRGGFVLSWIWWK